MSSVYDDFDPEEYHNSVFIEMDRALCTAQDLLATFEEKMKTHMSRLSAAADRSRPGCHGWRTKSRWRKPSGKL